MVSRIDFDRLVELADLGIERGPPSSDASPNPRSTERATAGSMPPSIAISKTTGQVVVAEAGGRPAPSSMHAAQSRTATFIRRGLLRGRRPSTSGAPRSSVRTTGSQRTPEAQDTRPDPGW